MIDPELNLRDDFPPVSYEEWRALVDADLKGASFLQKLVTHTYEWIDIQPLYWKGNTGLDADPSGFSGLPPYTRSSQTLGNVTSGWEICQEHAHPDIPTSNRAIREDIEAGVTSVSLRLSACGLSGLDPDARNSDRLAGVDGLMIYRTEEFVQLFDGADIEGIGISLDPDAAFIPAAVMLASLWEKRGIAKDRAHGAFNADPIAVLARTGNLPTSLKASLNEVSDLATWTRDNYPNVTAVRVETGAYHDAGADAQQDLGYSIATGVEYLRAMTAAGMSVDDAARQIVFGFSIGCSFFLAIAKLRAARRLWARVIEASGGSTEAGAMNLHVRPASRILTRRDPWVNILRNTVTCFAAAVGGARTITTEPFDRTLGFPDSASHRLARNTQIILQEESQLHRVIDPAGGSYYLEWLTDQLSHLSWEFFQDIERKGGICEALKSGWVAEAIDRAYTPKFRALSLRKDVITGVSEFANLNEKRPKKKMLDRPRVKLEAIKRLRETRPPDREIPGGFRMIELAEAPRREPGSLSETALEMARGGASIGQITSRLWVAGETIHVSPLPYRPHAGPFEELRDASDACLEETGVRPRVYLVKLGKSAQFAARVGFAKNFFESGGFEVISEKGFTDSREAALAFKKSGIRIAVICSSDKVYEQMVPEVAPMLKRVGARKVILAGAPQENETRYLQSGVDRFIFIRCNVLSTLRALLKEEGVLP